MDILSSRLPRPELFPYEVVGSAFTGYFLGIVFRVNPSLTSFILCIQLISTCIFTGCASFFVRSEGDDRILTLSKIHVFSSNFIRFATIWALYEFQVIGIFLFTLSEITIVAFSWNYISEISELEQKVIPNKRFKTNLISLDKKGNA